ncbi:MAG: DUF5615 family PIN-like protein [Chloroflexi bacterium]|nr:DUF5615 family PIN-like protein [Chloroflexota bacterium]
MKIYLYMDEDVMDKRLIATLRSKDMDVLTAREAKMIDQDDDKHLDYATEHSRVLVSFNMGDFQRLHKNYLKAGKHHAGIILSAQQKYSIGEYARRMLRLVAAKSAEDMRDHIEFLSDWVE